MKIIIIISGVQPRRDKNWLDKILAEGITKPTKKYTRGGRRVLNDLERYQEGYPSLQDEFKMTDANKRKRSKNLHFYQGKIVSQPDECTIDDFHNKWWGEYRKLEYEHGFIQWLFPIREEGMNFRSQKLYPHEMVIMKNDPQIRAKILHSYRLILDFYGMKIVNENTGEIGRTKSYKRRYDNLNHCFHNNLRITRILKCLGEMNLVKFKYPFLQHVIKEIYLCGNLRNCKVSCLNYWIP
eukprot:UN29633